MSKRHYKGYFKLSKIIKITNKNIKFKKKDKISLKISKQIWMKFYHEDSCNRWLLWNFINDNFVFPIFTVLDMLCLNWSKILYFTLTNRQRPLPLASTAKLSNSFLKSALSTLDVIQTSINRPATNWQSETTRLRQVNNIKIQ